MAERQTTMTPPQASRGDQRLDRPRSFDWVGSPFGSLRRFADEMDRIFDDFTFGRRDATSSRRQGATSDLWAPNVDVVQRANELVVKADLPGLSKDDVTVDISDDAITISGERQSEREEDRDGVYRVERSYGSFYRVIPLPEGAITEQAKAQFKDGVLQITMPAPPSQATRGRRLEIQGEKTKQ